MSSDRLGTAPAVGAGRVISVVIADDNARYRDGLVRAVSRREGMCVVGIAKDGAEAVEAARQREPDVLVADHRMPGLDGFRVALALRAGPAAVRTRVVLITAEPDDRLRNETRVSSVWSWIDKAASRKQICDEIERVGSA